MLPFTTVASTVSNKLPSCVDLSASGRGRRGKKGAPATTVQPRQLVTDAPLPDDLGDPLSDEEDPSTYNQSSMLPPVPAMVHNRSVDTGMIFKSEPVEGVEDSTSENIQMPSQLMEHCYSYMDHIGLDSSGQNQTPQTVEELPLSLIHI